MKRWYPLAAAAAVTAGMLAACSTGGEPAPESSTTGSAEPTVDLTALDPGAYPTDPRPPFGVAEDSQLVQVESQRMAQFIVAPFEVDPDLWLQEADLTEEFYRTFDGKVPPALYAELAALRYRLKLAQRA